MKNEKLCVFKLHHIDIWINNVEESIRFYSCLGFNKIKEIDKKELNKKFIFMEKDNVLLEMKYHYSNDCQHNNVKCSDNKVFGLSVENIEDAKEFVESNNLVEQEIIIDYGILGNKYFIIKDPNGINIEFIEDRGV